MNKLGPKNNVAEVVGLSKFDSPLTWILLAVNTKCLFHSIAQKFLILPLSLCGFLSS